jgi:hypothetical protein
MAGCKGRGQYIDTGWSKGRFQRDDDRSHSQADPEQAAALIIGNATLMGTQTVDPEPAFEGYNWYDRLPRITAIDFIFDHDGKSWIYGDSTAEYLPPDMPAGRVANLMLDLDCQRWRRACCRLRQEL